MDRISENHELYYYISSQAGYDPAKTIYVCAPEKDAASYEAAQRFAETSGWQEIAERDGAVLVLPVVPQGWKKESPTLLADIFYETKGKFASRSGKSLWGREGFLWCWETLVFLAGYEEGAVFGGNAVVATPGLFAAAALVGGMPDDYSAGEQPSGHYMVPGVGADYRLRNRDIPCCLWLFPGQERDGEEALTYFSQVNGVDQTPVAATLGGISAQIYANQEESIRQVRVSVGSFRSEPGLSKVIFEKLFQRVIRWKCGPDGKLTPFMSKEDFDASPRFEHDFVVSEGNRYDYLIHLPAGMSRAQAAGLPLVFSVHGRGEPAWMFAEKNGWDKLCDETKEFILAVPDSPGNIWFLDRDGRAFGAMIEKISEEYAVDRTRVYLTGFSNGGAITREAGLSYPSYFAGLSPWNAPFFLTSKLPGWEPVTQRIEREGWEMPYFFFCGDNDALALADSDGLLPTMVKVNGCGEAPTLTYTGNETYTREKGYKEGERMTTKVWTGPDGVSRVALTEMRDMPHGAIHDESRAAWAFLKRFRRPIGSKRVELVIQAEKKPAWKR